MKTIKSILILGVAFATLMGGCKKDNHLSRDEDRTSHFIAYKKELNKIEQDNLKPLTKADNRFKRICRIAAADVTGAWAGSRFGAKIGSWFGRPILGAVLGGAIVGGMASYGASIRNGYKDTLNQKDNLRHYIKQTNLGQSHNNYVRIFYKNGLKYSKQYVHNKIQNDSMAKEIWGEAKYMYDEIVQKGYDAKQLKTYLSNEKNNFIKLTTYSFIENITKYKNINHLIKTVNSYIHLVLNSNHFTIKEKNIF